MASNERQSLVTLGARPRADVIYEALLGLVVLGGAWWVLDGIFRTPDLAKNLSAGANALVKMAIGAVVIAIAGFLIVQTLVLNGRFGLIYGLVRDDAVYLATPEGVAGSRSKRLLCDGSVTMAMRTDSGTRGSSSTPATRARFESGGSKIVVVVNAPVGEPGVAQASIRAWLEGHGVKVEEVPYPTKGTTSAS